MIAANGLILLAQQEASLKPSNATGYEYYVEAAIDVRLHPAVVIVCLRCSSVPQQLLRANTELAWRPSWQSLLANGTVDNPEHNNLTGIVYGTFYTTSYGVPRTHASSAGDYYFVRAGNELLTMNVTTC